MWIDWLKCCSHYIVYTYTTYTYSVPVCSKPTQQIVFESKNSSTESIQNGPVRSKLVSYYTSHIDLFSELFRRSSLWWIDNKLSITIPLRPYRVKCGHLWNKSVKMLLQHILNLSTFHGLFTMCFLSLPPIWLVIENRLILDIWWSCECMKVRAYFFVDRHSVEQFSVPRVIKLSSFFYMLVLAAGP